MLSIAGCSLSFAYLLLKNIAYFNFKDFIVLPVVVLSMGYGLVVFLLSHFLASKKTYIPILLSVYGVVYLILVFQIANEARGEFGATWLPVEVFWELVVARGKGVYFLFAGLVLVTIGTVILPEKLYNSEK